MIRTTIKSIIICVGAVYADPYWNLIGVLHSILVRQVGPVKFFVYVSLLDLSSRKDSELELVVEDMENEEVLWEGKRLVRGDQETVGVGVFEVETSFPGEGVYNLTLKLDRGILRASKLRVDLLDQ